MRKTLAAGRGYLADGERKGNDRLWGPNAIWAHCMTSGLITNSGTAPFKIWSTVNGAMWERGEDGEALAQRLSVWVTNIERWCITERCGSWMASSYVRRSLGLQRPCETHGTSYEPQRDNLWTLLVCGQGEIECVGMVRQSRDVSGWLVPTASNSTSEAATAPLDGSL